MGIICDDYPEPVEYPVTIAPVKGPRHSRPSSHSSPSRDSITIPVTFVVPETKPQVRRYVPQTTYVAPQPVRQYVAPQPVREYVAPRPVQTNHYHLVNEVTEPVRRVVQPERVVNESPVVRYRVEGERQHVHVPHTHNHHHHHQVPLTKQDLLASHHSHQHVVTRVGKPLTKYLKDPVPVVERVGKPLTKYLKDPVPVVERVGKPLTKYLKDPVPVVERVGKPLTKYLKGPGE